MASKRVILTLEQRVNVIKKLDAGRSCRAVAQETGCGKTQITRIKQDRHEIMRDWQSGGRATIKIKRRTTPTRSSIASCGNGSALRGQRNCLSAVGSSRFVTHLCWLFFLPKKNANH